jgi:hypothetical protein
MNWEFIYNETLQWTIDGVNKTFTTLYNIEKIEEVYYLWAPYRNISFTNNVVTFVDAPTIWSTQPTIDYFKVTISPLSEWWDVTFWEIIVDVYDKIWQDRIKNSVANKVYKESLIKNYINNWFSRIKNLRLYKDIVRQYSFNKSKDWTIIWYNAGYLNIGENISYTPANWIAMFRRDSIMEYSSYSSWHLNWTTWVVYENWDTYKVWYKIPTWIKKVMEVIFEWEPLTYYDIREYNMWIYWYSIYKASNWDDYLLLPFTKDNEVVTVKYQSVYSVYSADEDIVGIEREYYELLSFYTLRKLFQYREDDRWQQAEKDYRELLKEYKSYKSRAVDWINNELKSNILTEF